MISIRQLIYFNALAQELHFGRAAELCCISQPALSMQVSELEQSLKIQLVVRHSRYITLTGQGKEIARRLKRILTSIDDLADFARHGEKLLTEPLKLSVIPTIGPYLLPRILPLLKTKFPELKFSLRESQTENLLQLLSTNHLDVSRLLLLEEGHCLRDQAASVCYLAGVGGFDEFGASSLATILQMVTNGYGITLLPDLCRPVETNHLPGISVLALKDPAPSRTIVEAHEEARARIT